MASSISLAETYAEQLSRWAQAMAVARNEAVYGVLAEGSLPGQVALFTDGNLEKRYDKLLKQLEFVAPAIEEFEDLVNTYILEVPLAAYDTSSSDGERFLSWMDGRLHLTPEQQDYVACQRARHAVEAVGRENRLKHIRFQELWSVAELLAERQETERLRVHLNPIRARSRFATRALLDEHAILPAEVVFFAVGTSIRTAILDASARRLIAELACFEPCALEQWACLSASADRQELTSFCRDLAGMGLVAFS